MIAIGCYSLLMNVRVKPGRRRGYTRVSAKHQVTIPLEALAKAGLQVGDRLKVEARGRGQIVFIREGDPVERFAGALTGVYPAGYLDELRGEWS